jgi:hypothetical protein
MKFFFQDVLAMTKKQEDKLNINNDYLLIFNILGPINWPLTVKRGFGARKA